jgi:hypothetical protein
MKKVIVMLAVIFIGGTAYAQTISEQDVPVVVKSKVTSLYPDVKVEKWKKHNGDYKAQFDENKKETWVIINPKGDLVKTKTEIEASDLPSSASEYIRKNYDGKKTSEAYKVIDATGVVTYKAEVDDTYLVFDANGMFIKKEKEKGKK